MKNGIADLIIWTTKTRGWHWIGPGDWEIVRDVDPHTDRTRFGVWHGSELTDFRASLDVAKLAAESEMTRERVPTPRSRSRYCGNNPDRQSVGDPGHCEDCCSVGHIVAHPDLGCGDVQCYSDHDDER